MKASVSRNNKEAPGCTHVIAAFSGCSTHLGTTRTTGTSQKLLFQAVWLSRLSYA